MTEAAYQPNELLSRLVTRRLLSVDFHLDRLELHFDGDDGHDEDAVLTCEVWPVVQQPGVVLRPEGFGYADALRALVGQLVMGTTEATGVGLVVELQGASLILHPGPDEPTGSEIALLRGFSDGAWMAWRPGEESFEDLA
jgi:hypothetical protein